MTKNMPDEIQFIFRDSRGIARDIIVFFVFRSRKKNDFTVGPLMTDENGVVYLKEKDVKRLIALTLKDFPMDYGGGINDCDSLRVLVESKSDLDRRADRLEMFYPDNALALRRLLERARNGNGSMMRDICLPITENIVDIAIF